MRKPAVVVAAVSAVLAGGIMVATAAGAQEPPGATAAPRLPAGAPAVPVDPGVAHGGPADAAGTARPGAGVGPAADAGPTLTARPAADDDAAQPAADDEPAKPAAAKAGTVTGSASYSAAHRDVTRGQALSADPDGAVQRQALDLVNDNRRRGGCGEVTVDRRLIAAANAHAADMARRGYFAHENTHGDRAGERVEDAGYRWSRFGENIARGQGSVSEVVDGWMRSPGHRANIMDCDLREVGVGLAFAGDRTPYWVQDFATAR